MCQPAPVALAYGRDVARVFAIPETYGVQGPGGVHLGIVGDQAHASHASSHNCAPNQESPVNGVAYHPNYAHAWDARPATKAIGEAMRAATLRDDRCRYVLYDNVGTKPNGETWTLDHPTYHVSFLPGTHDIIRPFFDEGDELMGVGDDILAKLREIDDDLPEKAAFERLQARVRAIGPALRAIQEGRPIDRKILEAIEGD